MRLEVSKGYHMCPICKSEELGNHVDENYVRLTANPKKYNSFIESIKNLKILSKYSDNQINEKISYFGLILIELRADVLTDSIVEYATYVKNENEKQRMSLKKIRENQIENSKLISQKDEKILQIKEESTVECQILTDEIEFKEKSFFQNLKYFLKLMEIIQKEKNIDIEEINKQLKLQKQVHPSFSDLQALYYVAMDYKIIFFKRWVRMFSKFENKCIECNGRIMEDDDIFWNPGTKKAKHFDCKTLIEQKKKISKLSESANNYFVRGENHQAMIRLNQIKKIKFELIFKNTGLSKTLEPILQNELNFTRFIKSFESSEWMNSAKNIKFEDFLKIYQKKFVEKCKDEIQIDITDEFNAIMTNKSKKEIFDNLVLNYFVKYSKNLTYILDSPEKNSDIFQKIVKSCGKHGFFYDPYMNSRLINYFAQNFPENTEMTELRLLTSINVFKIKDHLKSMKESVEEFKNYLEHKGIKLEVKVIQEKMPENHDRYFYGDNTNLTMLQGMDRFFILSKNATVVEIEPRFREKFREITEKSFRNESCMEFLENYEKMKSRLPERFDVKCSDCGTDCQVPFQPKQGRPVYCRECLQKHKKRSH